MRQMKKRDQPNPGDLPSAVPAGSSHELKKDGETNV
jgi:hypothetical protein